MINKIILFVFISLISFNAFSQSNSISDDILGLTEKIVNLELFAQETLPPNKVLEIEGDAIIFPDEAGDKEKSKSLVNNKIYDDIKEFNPKFFQQKWIRTWGADRKIFRYTQFSCDTLSPSEKVILTGVEMSYRDTSFTNDGSSACNYWWDITGAILTGNNIAITKRASEKFLLSGHSALYKDQYPMTLTTVHNNSGDHAGWYRALKDNFFSEGVFVKPITSKPKSGTFSYNGYIIVDDKQFSSSLVKIDFSKNKLTMMLRYDLYGAPRNLHTSEPIDVDPVSGKFSGVLDYSVLTTSGVLVNGKFGITGAVGGHQGNVVVAMIGQAGAGDKGFNHLIATRNR